MKTFTIYGLAAILLAGLTTLVLAQNNMDAANSSTSTWQPGPDSWRPGDPIPEQYRQQRNERSRFSRMTQEQQRQNEGERSKE